MKKIVFKVLMFIYILFFTISVKAIDTYSFNAVMYNLNDDEIIFDKNMDEKVKIASLTKIMTAIVALENIPDIKDTVEMSRNAFLDLDGYVTSGIKVGDIVTYEDLLYGIMLPSGADCANQIALSISGSVDDFVLLMNEKALELGLENTHFSNPIGKDYDNYSSVHDVAIILKYALGNDDFYKIFTTRSYTTTTDLKLESTLLERAEKYNLDISNILGSKTGFTDDAGYCLASIANINNISYLLVTTRANTNMPYQLMDAISLYDYFSKNYSYKKILGFNKELVTIKIDGFVDKDYDIYSDNDIYMYLSNDINIDNISYDYVGETSIKGKAKKDEYLGKVNISYQGELLYSYDVFLDRDISNDSYLFLLIPVVLILIILYIIVIMRRKSNLQS